MNAPKNKSVTLRDLADSLGLDPSTVSRALREDRRRVSITTIKRVTEAAKELGYVPDPLAVGLRVGRTRSIGVLVTALTDSVMGALATSIEDSARHNGFVTLVVPTAGQEQLREAAIKHLLERRVDGLIICDSPMGREVHPAVEAAGVPVVFAMRRCPDKPSISSDDRLGGGLAASHLHALGHTRIAVIRGPSTARTAQERVDGFLSVAQEKGMDVSVCNHRGYEVEDGYKALRAMRGRDVGTLPTAVFATNDCTAIGALRGILDIFPPDNVGVAVVGYNNLRVSKYLSPSLTSVETSVAEMGTEAVDVLLQILDGGRPETVLLKPQLKARESTLNYGLRKS